MMYVLGVHFDSYGSENYHSKQPPAAFLIDLCVDAVSSLIGSLSAAVSLIGSWIPGMPE